MAKPLLELELKNPTLREWWERRGEFSCTLTGAEAQSGFVAGHLSRLVDCASVRVVAEHRSKSVLLPVYRLEGWWGTVLARGNFDDWKLTVDLVPSLGIDLEPYDALFRELFTSPSTWSLGPTSPRKIPVVYCDGFRPEWIRSLYSWKALSFTEEVRSDHELWTVLFILRQAAAAAERRR